VVLCSVFTHPYPFPVVFAAGFFYLVERGEGCRL
jgi:hypothetical protein